MGSSLLNIGVTGMLTAQTSLVVTGHNITNVNTPGYHRQLAVQSSMTPQFTGSGFIGQGVKIDTVEQRYSKFLDTQVWQVDTQNSYYKTYAGQIDQINNMLGDPQSGLAPALQDFFSGVQEVAAHPSSTPSRQSMLSASSVLVARYQQLDSRITEIRGNLNQDVTAKTNQINTYASQIANFNEQIVLANSQSGGAQPPNDLLDQRAQAITQLNQLVQTQVVEQSDGTLNVYIGQGQSLVVGQNYNNLTAAPSQSDPEQMDLFYQQPGGPLVPINMSSIQGGELGALINFREQSLNVAENSLGRVALVMAQTFNDQHELGQDLNGVLGGAYFSVGVSRVASNANNTGTGVVAATISNVDQLTTSDYRIAYQGGNYTITRLSDNTSSGPFATLPQTIDGVDFNLASGTPNNGDSFLAFPTRTGARDLNLAITDPAKIAAAAPIRATSATGNLGDAKISAPVVNAPPPPNANLQQPVSITFTSATTFDVTGTGTGNPTGLTYTPGANISYNGWTLNITGTPKPGDVFNVQTNSSGVADNRNALLLAKLQVTNTMAGGTTSYQGAYSQLVSAMGNQGKSVQMNSESNAALLDQVTGARESFSGVNLDEEAANLLRFQQMYQAAAKVIQTGEKVFESLLQLGA